jgi:hypothetical protein
MFCDDVTLAAPNEDWSFYNSIIAFCVLLAPDLLGIGSYVIRNPQPSFRVHSAIWPQFGHNSGRNSDSIFDN